MRISKGRFRFRNKLFVLLLFASANAISDPVVLLSNPRDAANARFNLANEAQEELIAVTYIAYPDRGGLQFLNELRNTARKGKRVVLVLDSMLNLFPKNMLSYLQLEGLEIYIYHKFDLKQPLQYLERMHDKLFIVDRKKLVVGDRNVSSGYYAMKDNSFISRDLYAEGQPAQDAADYVEKLIKSNQVKRFLGKKLTPEQLKTEKLKLDALETKKLTEVLRTSTEWKNNMLEADSVQFFNDPVGKKGKEPGTYEAFLKDVENAQKTIAIESPYVVLDDRMKTALKSASERGVRIRIVTNAMPTIDKAPVAALWEEERNFLASMGAEVWEHPGGPEDGTFDKNPVKAAHRAKEIVNHIKTTFAGQTNLHAKTANIDGNISYVMSMNMDERSFHINTESALRVVGKQFGQALLNDVESSLVEMNYLQAAADGTINPQAKTKEFSCVLRVFSKLIKSQL